MTAFPGNLRSNAITGQNVKLALVATANVVHTNGTDNIISGTTVAVKENILNLGICQPPINTQLMTNERTVDLDDGGTASMGGDLLISVNLLNPIPLDQLKGLKDAEWTVFLNDPAIDTSDLATYSDASTGAQASGYNIMTFERMTVMGEVSNQYSTGDPLVQTLTFSRKNALSEVDGVGEGVTLTFTA